MTAPATTTRSPLVGALVAEGISFVGTRVSMIAIPWFVLSTTGSATQTGLVAADQPFYRVYALGDDGGFVAYAAEGVLEEGQSVLLPDDADRWFTTDGLGHHAPLDEQLH